MTDNLSQDGLSAGDATAEQNAELRHALEQKTALLHEVDHRVKNNLQLIASLLLLQTRRVKDPAVKAALHSVLERINAVATVHRRLFQNEDVATFDVAAFVRDLADDALGAVNRPDIRITLDAQAAQAPANIATPIALVINELLLNALCHAFPPGRGGMITLKIAGNRHSLRIEIADDGVGMAKTSSASDGAGLGLTIVDLLSQQLRAEVERDWDGPGVRTVLQLPLEAVG